MTLVELNYLWQKKLKIERSQAVYKVTTLLELLGQCSDRYMYYSIRIASTFSISSSSSSAETEQFIADNESIQPYN